MKKMMMILGVLALGNVNAMLIEESYDALTGDVSALIEKPTHNGSNMPFSYESNENGVCKALGYERAVSGSRRHGFKKADTIEVSSSGRVVSGPRDYVLQQIVCLNKAVGINEYSIKIIKPQHLGSKMPFSYESNENGVCKALGYERAASGSRRHVFKKADSIEVSSSGSVVSGSRDVILDEIVCLDRNF